MEKDYKKPTAFLYDKLFWVNRLSGRGQTKAFESCMNHVSTKSFNSKRKELVIERELYHQVDFFCQQYHCSVSHYFIGLLFTLNNSYGNETPLIGLPSVYCEEEWLKNTAGSCMNILPFSIEISADSIFTDILFTIKSELNECYNHQQLDLYNLLKELNDEFHSFNLIFLYQEERNILDNKNHFSLHNYLNQREQIEDLIVHLQAPDEKEDYILSLNYREDLFSSEVIDNLLIHFKYILTFLLSHPSHALSNIPYLSKEEQQQLLVDFNDNHLPLPNDKTIIDLFEEQVMFNPTSIALLFKDQSFTYLQVNEMANQMAAYIRQQYIIQPGEIVAIAIQRSEWVVITIFAILKTGAAYLPIDQIDPQARQHHMLEDSGCSLVIDETVLESFKIVQRNLPTINTPRFLTQENKAYIIYTSGSTGTPKGVVISHRNVFAFICWCRHHFTDTPFDILFSSTNPCFDLFIFEIFYPLLSGKKVRLLEWSMAIPHYLSSATKVMLNTVPSIVGVLLKDAVNLNNISALNMAGESIPPLLLKDLNPNHMEIRNLYGPSESTTYSTVYKIKSDG
jgi:non-ribosomal peptide synthetase component F